MKLSRAQERARQELVAELRAAAGLVELRFSELLGLLKHAVMPLNDAIETYNTAQLKAAAFAKALAEDFRSDFEDKSDTWREGERGQEADAFISEWEEFDPDRLPKIYILEPELEEKPCHAEALDRLPADSQ